MTAEIRPGVQRPDWSVVTRPTAREALRARDRSRSSVVEKWNHALEPEQDRVWRAVLELFPVLGRPPLMQETVNETGLPAENLQMLVFKLQAHDFLGIDEATRAIAYAYPFTGQETGHRVRLLGRQLNAVCAVDALGIAGMFRTDIIIMSSCRACGGDIEVGTAKGGKSLSHARPVDAVVWYDFSYSGCAAVSCCRSIAFFCSKAELQQWLTAQSPQPIGYRLTLDEALEVGRALFEPVLATWRPLEDPDSALQRFPTLTKQSDSHACATR